MSKSTCRNLAPEPFVIFLPVARKRQADDLLDAFDMQTEKLLTGADRAIEFLRVRAARSPKTSLRPRRGGAATAAKRRARGASPAARNWVRGVRY